MTPLRQRMIEDMQLRRLAPQTQKAYVSAVRRLTQPSPSPLDFSGARVPAGRAPDGHTPSEWGSPTEGLCDGLEPECADQASHDTYFTAQLCHPSVRSRREFAGHTSLSGHRSPGSTAFYTYLTDRAEVKATEIINQLTDQLS
jgi:hypothetical protein